MKNKRFILFFLFFVGVFSRSDGQFIFGFSNEIGVGAGPLLFQSDFGLRNNINTNINNVGLGVALMHYMNFAYRSDCNCYSRDVYFNDHFKIRNEIDYHYTKLSHEGPESKKDSDKGRDLRDHKGTSSVIEIGSQVEYFPLSVRDFQAGAFLIAPYISLGVHYVSYQPGYSSIQDIPGIPPEDAYFDRFLEGTGKLGGIDDSAGHTTAITGSVGFRFKIGILSDLNFELRHHRYFSNWVDGLNPDVAAYPPNKYDDSIVWLQVGYIYYLNF
ncbi:THC0290_0291 family protein [Flavimarina sp. Hel_I_48]|uniref:THC0290_0291 family protein n=1 Tax=Flavimarina sp. Hel_I_48 TaxID=1392488 RepID=UPI0004DF96D1|nr:hypothetical protein [Flavimarina sp. Hel_I_48]